MDCKRFTTAAARLARPLIAPVSAVLSPTAPAATPKASGGTNTMRHFSCDLCGKDMTPTGTPRYTVKMEAFAAADPAELTDDDLGEDHVEEMARMLTELEDGDEPELPPAATTMQFDLCPACYRKFAADPLGRETANKFDFSEN